VFVAWCTERGINKDFASMPVKEVVDCLWRFYEETGSKTSEEYSRSTLLGVRNAIERNLTEHNRFIKNAKKPCLQREQQHA